MKVEILSISKLFYLASIVRFATQLIIKKHGYYKNG